MYKSLVSETVKLKNLNASNKVYSDFIDFNTELFQQKMVKYLHDLQYNCCRRFAKKKLKKMTILNISLKLRIETAKNIHQYDA